MSINLRTFFKLLVLIGLATTLILLLSFADLSTIRTNFHVYSRRSYAASTAPWTAAIDHSRCPLDRHFKVYLYNHHRPQHFRQSSPFNGLQSLLRTLESRLKQKQAWAMNPEEACVFLVVLHPFFNIQIPTSSHGKSAKEQENRVITFLSSLPYWTFHGSEGRNHIIVDLFESSTTAQAAKHNELVLAVLQRFTNIGEAIMVTNT